MYISMSHMPIFDLRWPIHTRVAELFVCMEIGENMRRPRGVPCNPMFSICSRHFLRRFCHPCSREKYESWKILLCVLHAS